MGDILLQSVDSLEDFHSLLGDHSVPDVGLAAGDAGLLVVVCSPLTGVG